MSSSNVKLKSTNRSGFIGNANDLLERTYRVLERGFPLSVEEVWAGVSTHEDRERFKALREHGFYMPTGIELRVWFRTEGIVVPGHVEIKTDRRVLPMFGNSPQFNLDAIEIEQQRAVVKWVNAAVRQRRIVAGAKAIVREFINHRCGDSLASLYTRWPDFAPVLMEERVWAERVRHLPTIKRKEYDWSREPADRDYGWYLDNMEKLDAIGGLIAGAKLLKLSDNNDPVRAEVVDWEKQRA